MSLPILVGGTVLLCEGFLDHHCHPIESESPRPWHSQTSQFCCAPWVHKGIFGGGRTEVQQPYLLLSIVVQIFILNSVSCQGMRGWPAVRTPSVPGHLAFIGMEPLIFHAQNLASVVYQAGSWQLVGGTADAQEQLQCCKTPTCKVVLSLIPTLPSILLNLK